MLAPSALAGAALYYPRLRPWILTWGATAEEAGVSLPGDEPLEDADGVATRAITIAAPAEAVWPWIVQMGPSPRGGAYTYDWIENLLGLNMHNADRVLPEFQNPQVGDGFGYGTNRMSFTIVEPEHVLASRSADGNWVWTFVLEERDGNTRLLSRNRFRLPRLRDRIGMIPMEPGSLVMERKMLLGIKQRAERLARERSTRLVSAQCTRRLPISASVDLYWLPLGAGGHSVRLNGKLFEAVAPRVEKRPAQDLYHAAIAVTTPEGFFVIEQAPSGPCGEERGIVAEGSVGLRAVGCLRLFRYEIRRWRDGVIPDLDEAVDSPQRLSDDPAIARRVLEVVADVPTPVWGRDDLRAGEMWNSNSIVSWVLSRAGVDLTAIHLPARGRAPGWHAGLVVAARQTLGAPDEPALRAGVQASRWEGGRPWVRVARRPGGFLPGEVGKSALAARIVGVVARSQLARSRS